MRLCMSLVVNGDIPESGSGHRVEQHRFGWRYAWKGVAVRTAYELVLEGG